MTGKLLYTCGTYTCVVCTYVCTHVCVYAYICVCMYVCMYVLTEVSIIRVKQAVAKKDEAMKSLRTQHEVYIYTCHF